MILSKEQINRYMRHIIMPEISGQGQKKLLDSKVCIYGENVNAIKILTLYLSAMGIGSLYISVKDEVNFEELCFDATDLNSDIEIELLKKSADVDFRIVLGNCKFVKSTVSSFNEKYIPTVLAVNNNWKSILRVFTKFHELYSFAQLLNSECENISPFINELTGAIASVEIVKLCLNIGIISNDILLIDVLDLTFDYYKMEESNLAVDYLEKNHVNYSGNNLFNAKVLIVGAGGLGSPSALSLAMAGIKTIGIVDFDNVELSNLNRQILHSVSRLGMAKGESAKYFLEKINDVTVKTYIESLSSENVYNIIEEYDLVISAVDNIQTRYLINDACYFAKKPIIEAGVLRFHGTNTTIIPDEGHCYRCLYPNINVGDMSCSEAGVLGAVPGVMGIIQGSEAYKLLTNIGTILKNKILLYDALEMEFNVIDVERNPECPICGNNPTIKELESYSAV